MNTASARLLRLIGWAGGGEEEDEDEVVAIVVVVSEGCCLLMPPNVGMGLDFKEDDADDVDLGGCCCALGANNGAIRTGGDVLVFDAAMSLLRAPWMFVFFSLLALVISSFGKSSSISILVLGCF